MKKVTICLLLCGVIAASAFFVACNRSAGSALASYAEGSSGQTTVRLLTDATGIDDKSFNAAAWRGILEYYGDTWQNQSHRGRAYDVVTAVTQDMYIPNIR